MCVAPTQGVKNRLILVRINRNSKKSKRATIKQYIRLNQESFEYNVIMLSNKTGT
jgi:hypothetical protein